MKSLALNVKCPVCGDPNVFPLWIDEEPPKGCPDDFDNWGFGYRPQVKSVSECTRQMEGAKQQADFRKLVPDAFDENGNMKPGRFIEVLKIWHEANPGKPYTMT